MVCQKTILHYFFQIQDNRSSTERSIYYVYPSRFNVYLVQAKDINTYDTYV